MYRNNLNLNIGMNNKRFWLFKTEPSEFSIAHLAASPNQTTSWGGVRNYMARNLLRDEVKLGDNVFVYHSSTKDKGIAGIAEITRAAYPDPTAFDPASAYYDPKSIVSRPTWFAVDIHLIEVFSEIVSLSRLKQTRRLKRMMVCQQGARLSIQPVAADEWRIICQMARSAFS